METNLIQNLEHQYHSMRAANPEWDRSLVQYLLGVGMTTDCVWTYYPEEARTAGMDEPEWL